MDKFMKRSILFLIIALFLFAACTEHRIVSRWKDRDIIIDGIDNEWQGARYLIDKKNITIGVMNDESSLYIRLSTHNKVLQSMIAEQGMSVVFEAPREKGKLITVKYPVGNSQSEPDSLASDEGFDMKKISSDIAESLKSGHITIKKGDISQALSLSEAADEGIECRMAVEGGQLVYELRMPINSSASKLAEIDAPPGESIEIEIKIEEASRLKKQKDEYARNNKDANNRLTRRGSRRPPSIGKFSKAIAFWIKIDLAEK